MKLEPIRIKDGWTAFLPRGSEIFASILESEDATEKRVITGISSLASCLALPGKGHLDAVLHLNAYFIKKPNVR
jgi:hypothetical protein